MQVDGGGLHVPGAGVRVAAAVHAQPVWFARLPVGRLPVCGDDDRPDVGDPDGHRARVLRHGQWHDEHGVGPRRDHQPRAVRRSDRSIPELGTALRGRHGVDGLRNRTGVSDAARREVRTQRGAARRAKPRPPPVRPELTMTLTFQRHLFDIPRDVCYLNCAYMGPIPRPIHEAGEAALLPRARPWQISADDFFEPAESARRLIGELINASTERIAFVPNVANAMAAVAKNVPIRPQQEIVLLAEQFPSNVYSWRKLAAAQGARINVVQAPAGADRARIWNERLVESIH